MHKHGCWCEVEWDGPELNIFREGKVVVGLVVFVLSFPQHQPFLLRTLTCKIEIAVSVERSVRTVCEPWLWCVKLLCVWDAVVWNYNTRVVSVHGIHMQRKTNFRSGPVKSCLTYMQFRKIKRRRVGEIDRLPTVSTALSQHMECAPAFSTKEQNFAHFCAL